MESCLGDINVTVKVDRDMAEYLQAESERLGVSRAAFVRRLMMLYRRSRREEMDCPHCAEPITVDLS